MPEAYPLLDRRPVEPGGVAVALWRFLGDLSDAFPGQWALVGGQMVLLHGLEHGEVPERETTDADVLIDVRAERRAIARMSLWLSEQGVAFAGSSPEGIGHRFRGNGMTVDLLAPDHLGPRADLTTVAGARTLEVPAGTRILRAVHRVPVLCEGSTAYVPRPDLPAAIVAKAAAISLGDAARHKLDLVFMLGLIGDVRAVADRLDGKSDFKRLRSAARQLPDDDRAWRASQRPDDARAALRYLCAQG